MRTLLAVLVFLGSMFNFRIVGGRKDVDILVSPFIVSLFVLDLIKELMTLVSSTMV